MRRPLRWLIATAGASLACAALPAGALAASSPAIEWTSAWNITPSEATLGAQINPEGLSGFGAYYQFQVVTNTSEYLSEIACPPRAELKGTDGCMGPEVEGVLPIGSVPDGTKGEAVSLDLASAGMTLKPGTTYHYRVLAVTALVSEDTLRWESPAVVGPDQTFTTPPAGQAPVIESVSISHLTPTDATLEARIDTEGLSTSYEFQMWSSPCSHKGVGCELLIEVHLPTGLLLGSFVPQSVSLDLNSAGVTLRSGEYGFSMVAANEAGSTSAFGGVFEAPPGVLDPPGPTVSPGPVSNEPEVPLGGEQHTTSVMPTSPPLGGSGPAGVPSKTGAGKTSGKPKPEHGKHHKRKHHHTNAAKHVAKSKKHKR